jgi:predicted transcriptional regulator of viral defense system
MANALDYLRSRGGYGRMHEMKGASIQTREISRLVETGAIEKIKPGLYRLAHLPKEPPFRTTLLDVCAAIPQGVICLLSALDYHGLTTFNPTVVFVAIPHSDKPPSLSYPPIRAFYLRDRFYAPGIVEVRTNHGRVRVYSMEKTICDMFRYRRKLGEGLALEALKAYLRRKDANPDALRRCAEDLQVKTVMLPYLRALVT